VTTLAMTPEQAAPARPRLAYDQKRMERLALLTAAGLLAFLLYRGMSASALSVAASLGIFAFAMLPIFVWASRPVSAIPIFPLHAMTFIVTYAFPIASQHIRVALFPPEAHIFAAFTVCCYLGVGFFAWYLVMKGRVRRKPTVLLIPWDRATQVGLVMVFVGGVVLAAESLIPPLQQMLFGSLPTNLVRPVRILSSNMMLMGGFFVSLAWGERRLPLPMVVLFLSLVVMGLMSLMTGMVLAALMPILIIVTAGFVVGRKRLPLKTFALILFLLSVFHAGKQDIRDIYWRSGVSADQAPAMIVEWWNKGINNLFSGDARRWGVREPRQRIDLMTRASLAHMLLLAQEEMPRTRPFMEGDTYRVIPQLLVPRLIWRDKPSVHEGTHRINIHFGLQTRRQTHSTTIGWGTLAEGFVNFGLMGVIVIGFLTGLVCGWIERSLIGLPLNAVWFLVGLLMLRLALLPEATLGVLVSSFIQTMLIIGVLALFLADRRPRPEMHPT
jgi:hypothetical protein